MAKPDHFYDEYIIPQFGDAVDIIGIKIVSVDWLKYDLIFLCGGDTIKLQKGLVDKAFDMSRLKYDVVILGDSAGAMFMSPYFYETEDRVKLSFHKGDYDATNTIVIVHTNNHKYSNDDLVASVSEFVRPDDVF